MAKRYILQGKQEYHIPFFFQIYCLKSNTGVETITAKDGFTVASSIIGGGFSDEQTIYTFTGKSFFNKATSIATLKVEANDNYYFPKSPFLKGNFNQNIKLLLTKIDKISTNKSWQKTKRRNVYTFDIVYINKEKTTSVDGLKASLLYSSVTTGFRDSIIDKLVHHFENTNTNFPAFVHSGGSNGIIKVYGEPESEFALAINENTLDVELEEDGSTETGRLIHNEVNDISIIDPYYASSEIDWYGKKINIIKDKIGRSGKSILYQNFPNNQYLNVIQGAVSSSHTITLGGSIDNIKVGDYFLAKGYGIKHKVHSIVSTDNKQIRLNSTLTLADRTQCKFMRDKSYTIHVLPDLSSTLGPSIPDSRSYQIKQYPDTLVTFKVKVPGTVAVTHQATSQTYVDKTWGTGEPLSPHKRSQTEYSASGLSAGDDFTYSVFAKVSRKRYMIPINIKLKMAAQGGKVFKVTRVPNFNYMIGHDGTGTPSSAQLNGGSDWTNSIPQDNSGTVAIGWGSSVTLSTASVTNDTCEMGFSIQVDRIGIKDVEFELDLEKIFTVGTP